MQKELQHIYAEMNEEQRMKTPMQTYEQMKSRIKPQWKTAFLTVVVFGLLTHLPIMLSDIPNHDGLDSIYFDQNMITSGRWFLTIACGFSSYFSIPWVIGIISLFFLALTGVCLTELLQLENKITIVLCCGLLSVFPSLPSTFAYVFTMDGYMMALLFSVLSVLLVQKGKYGFLVGGVFLGLSLGIYQAYLPFAVLLCVYMALLILMEEGKPLTKVRKILPYLYMGMWGLVFYYGMLRILLLIQGKELASYQGINGSQNTMTLVNRVIQIYRDFVAFTLKGNVFFNNFFSAVSLVLLAGVCLMVVGKLVIQRKWWKTPGFFVIMVLSLLGIPFACNLIFVISPQVTYHLLMRYQWALLLILAIAFVDRFLQEKDTLSGSLAQWIVFAAGTVLILNYAVTDNIAYSNLEKRYEKTYAYCERLLDRIEQTPGYYQGIPIAMIGVVGEEQYPLTDISGKVTSGMIGMNGDVILYTGANYEAFIKHYLGATLNILPPEAMAQMYYSKEYQEMDSFPGEDSIRIIDGIMYVKTENKTRE